MKSQPLNCNVYTNAILTVQNWQSKSFNHAGFGRCYPMFRIGF